MANIASQTTVLTNVRATGSKNAAGEQFGGIYYPAHTKNGKNVSARWEGNIALNGKPYTNAAGERVEGKTTYMRLIVWNGKNSAAGKGLADVFAKSVSIGKEISCNVRIESFDKRLFINGQPMLKQDGSVVTYMAHNFVFEDKLVFGADSAKVVAAETARWNGQPTFDSRPPLWNVPGSGDQQAWSTLVAPARKAAVWDGQSDRYGYARVIVPEGAVIGNANMQQPAMPTQTNQVNQQTIPAGTMPTQAATIVNQPVNNAQPLPVNNAQTLSMPVNTQANTAATGTPFTTAAGI